MLNMCKRANLSFKWFITVRAGLHHGLSVNHLPEDFHRVVQQLCRPDAGPAGGFGLLELSQQVTGPQGPFRQRLLHPAHTLEAWFQTSGGGGFPWRAENADPVKVLFFPLRYLSLVRA